VRQQQQHRSLAPQPRRWPPPPPPPYHSADLLLLPLRLLLQAQARHGAPAAAVHRELHGGPLQEVAGEWRAPRPVDWLQLWA
jgi:hypothetical protein